MNLYNITETELIAIREALVHGFNDDLVEAVRIVDGHLENPVVTQQKKPDAGLLLIWDDLVPVEEDHY